MRLETGGRRRAEGALNFGLSGEKDVSEKTEDGQEEGSSWPFPALLI